mmetsp:Transcript_43468/g.70537  ORF Transcript_43468/g.70537 Transcript_43468/m.70537 type:complete len:439 (-) Transcript_43468:501-1817(-)
MVSSEMIVSFAFCASFSPANTRRDLRRAALTRPTSNQGRRIQNVSISCSSNHSQDTRQIPRPAFLKQNPAVLFIGGNGAVGSAASRAMRLMHGDTCKILIGGRTRATVEGAAAAVNGEPIILDYRDRDALRKALKGVDCVVHTAGPFQNSGDGPVVLEECLHSGIPYVDVCDDIKLARQAKLLSVSSSSGVPAIVSAGAFPGLSNVMAAELIERSGQLPETLEFSYFCAGSGGAGEAVMSATFMLAAEPVTTYIDGQLIDLPAFSGRKVVDFGSEYGIGKRPVYLYELPETSQLYRTYAVPNILSRFGTSPDAWNLATRLVAEYTPIEVLRDAAKVKAFVTGIMPLIRLVDRFVGSALGMRVDVISKDGSARRAIYSHRDTVEGAGLAAAAFATLVLWGRVRPGVWFPEEALPSVEDRQLLFDLTTDGGVTSRFSWWS